MDDINKGEDYFSVDEQYEECCTESPWFNQTIWQNIHVPLFEELFFIAHEDIYDLICVLHTYDKHKEHSTGGT